MTNDYISKLPGRYILRSTLVLDFAPNPKHCSEAMALVLGEEGGEHTTMAEGCIQGLSLTADVSLPCPYLEEDTADCRTDVFLLDTVAPNCFSRGGFS